MLVNNPANRSSEHTTSASDHDNGLASEIRRCRHDRIQILIETTNKAQVYCWYFSRDLLVDAAKIQFLVNTFRLEWT
eukprot:m.42096 g.42096  ORF g.42096 m.42096 type:complete len:77 (+) comp15000_c0_seq2:2188-2418(+)